MYESLKMGVHGRVWVGASKYKQRGAKTSQNEEQLRDQDMFSRAITLQNIPNFSLAEQTEQIGQ